VAHLQKRQKATNLTPIYPRQSVPCIVGRCERCYRSHENLPRAEVLGVLAFGAAGAVWLLLPFIDGGRARKWVNALAALALTYIVGMTIYGHYAQ
jgi:quinol-cytochrome oxidoreductase complex cytochrome b subunit